ncbi:MAG: NUDIX hydrolase [Treponemataceae bacterium]|nr:MAG: NUDIX hydrolase [Treponemataceae bacterium]
MDIIEKIIKEEEFYRSEPYAFCTVDVELPNKKTKRRVLVKHPGSVVIFAVDDEKRCVMAEQYRFAVRQTLWEVPAGKLDAAAGEDPEQGARRELEEETGFIADEWIYLGKVYPTPGILDEVMHFFAAKKLHKTAQNLDDDEFINPRWITMDELSRRIADGTINDGKTITAFTLARLKNIV